MGYRKKTISIDLKLIEANDIVTNRLLTILTQRTAQLFHQQQSHRSSWLPGLERSQNQGQDLQPRTFVLGWKKRSWKGTSQQVKWWLDIWCHCLNFWIPSRFPCWLFLLCQSLGCDTPLGAAHLLSTLLGALSCGSGHWLALRYESEVLYCSVFLQ